MPPLNENHCRHILSGFVAIDKRMAELETLIGESENTSPFSQHVRDLSPTECRVLRDHFARIRSAMRSHLDELSISLKVRKSSVRWALQTNLMHLQVAVDDMGPRQLEGYGKLDPSGQAAVASIQDDLTRLLDRVRGYLQQGLGHDLCGRLARLNASRTGLDTLTVLERIITRWRLVEYRPHLEMIVSRLEKPCFEIAVFGRVSLGKSSLLNHIAGLDVLPVGVTPVTAVPTRLEYGDEAKAIVSFSEVNPRRIEVSELWEYASEQGNPGNERHVTSIVVHVPSSRLKPGAVLVDTPGLGSLATSGASEAMAYLPRCDLGIVLIDAVQALDQVDVALVRTLYEAGVPAMIILSKADLLSTTDRERMTAYIGGQFHHELGLALPVHPVSVADAHESLLLQWFDSVLSPLFERHQSLAEGSLRRKIAALSESVSATVESLLHGGRASARENAVEGLTEVRRLLDLADLGIRSSRQQVLDWSMGRERIAELIIEYAAQEVASGRYSSGTADALVFDVARELFARRAGMARELVSGLEQTLRRALDGIRQSWPLASHVNTQGLDLKLTGLPVPDLESLRARSLRLRPWWASVFPLLAVRVARGRIERTAGREIDACADAYDRQLGAWAKLEIERLVDHYELEAAPVREQVRRVAANESSAFTSGDGQNGDALDADLQALRRAAQGMPLPS